MAHGMYPATDLSRESLQNNGLHLDHPPVLTSKSYALQNALGEGPTGSHGIYSAPQLATPSHDWQRIEQEPIEVRHMILDFLHYLISCRA